MKIKLIIVVISLLTVCQAVWAHQPVEKETLSSEVQVLIEGLKKDDKYQPLLEGNKNSVKMEAGRVTKLCGEKGSLHSTKNYEEILMVLEGKGVINIGGKEYSVKAGEIIYIPPHHEHQVRNDKSQKFEYIYVAAPAVDK